MWSFSCLSCNITVVFELLAYLFPCCKKLSFDYNPMPKYTPYILVNPCPPLHFCAHSFFHVPIWSFVLYPCYTPVNSCCSSSTSTLSRPPEFEGSSAQWTLKPITIAVQHLSDWLYTCTGAKQIQTACKQAINTCTRNTLTNGQDWVCPGKSS